MTKRRNYQPWDDQRYHCNTKTCVNGHQGRIGKNTHLCAGCLQAHLEAGGYKWR
jgi:hypothetical protein